MSGSLRSPLADPTRRSRNIAAVLATGALAACAASAIASTGMVALNVLRKAFVGVAGENYGEPYKEDADKLFQVVAKTPEKPGEPGAAQTPDGTAPAGTPGAPGAPGTAQGASGGTWMPLALEVGLLKEEIVGGRSIPTPIQDGEIVYDRFGTHGAGDNLKFMFRTNAEAWVYVISIDGTGWIQPIFPSGYAGQTNPVLANQTYLFPEGSNWAPLDSYRGIEHLYFIASRAPRPDLEKELAVFASKVREVDPNRKEAEAVQLAQVQVDAPIARGFEPARKSVVADVPSQTGEKFPVDAQVFAASGPGDIVLTRWFRHQ